MESRPWLTRDRNLLFFCKMKARKKAENSKKGCWNPQTTTRPDVEVISFSFGTTSLYHCLRFHYHTIKFRYSEKSTKNWRNLPLSFYITEKSQNLEEDCANFLWPSQNVWTLPGKARERWAAALPSSSYRACNGKVVLSIGTIDWNWNMI